MYTTVTIRPRILHESFSMADRAGYLVAFGATSELVSHPRNQLPAQSISGRFGEILPQSRLYDKLGGWEACV